MDRRQFLFLAGGGLWGCAAILPVQGRLDGRVVQVGLGELGASIAAQGYALVQAEGLSQPLLIHQEGEGGYLALSAACTHLGCQVRPARQALICPCHGSSFSWEGEVLRGPAQQPLPRYRAAARGGVLEITID